jgi:hypothetical protein
MNDRARIDGGASSASPQCRRGGGHEPDRGRSAAAAQDRSQADPRRSKTPTPAVRTEIENQKKQLDAMLQVIRSYELPAGEPALHGVPSPPSAEARMIGEDVLYPRDRAGSRIRSRKLSPVELTESYLARIRTHAGALNAFATVTPTSALREAKEAEREISRGKSRGPLHGFPTARRISSRARASRRRGERRRRGTRCSIGTRRWSGSYASRARAPRQARDGRVRWMPWIPLRRRVAPGTGTESVEHGPWTGGSSLRIGAAVAAGLVGFAIGTETWGSILCPSAFCGTTGFAPPTPREPRGRDGRSWTLDKIGPMARDAADCRAVLEAIADRTGGPHVLRGARPPEDARAPIWRGSAERWSHRFRSHARRGSARWAPRSAARSTTCATWA